MSVENRLHSHGKPRNWNTRKTGWRVVVFSGLPIGGFRQDAPYRDICHRKEVFKNSARNLRRRGCPADRALWLTNLTARPTHFASEARWNAERLHSRRRAAARAEDRPGLAEPETRAGAVPQRSAQLSPQRLRISNIARAVTPNLVAAVRFQEQPFEHQSVAVEFGGPRRSRCGRSRRGRRAWRAPPRRKWH